MKQSHYNELVKRLRDHCAREIHDWDLYLESADLIEQQMRRIAYLEDLNQRLFKTARDGFEKRDQAIEALRLNISEMKDALAGAAVIVDTAGAEIRAQRGQPFPPTLTPPLRRVLGMMLWETGPIAHALRATGQDIARKAEDEQAAVLHWLVGFVLKHGADWHKHAAIALHEMTDSITGTGEA